MAKKRQCRLTDNSMQNAESCHHGIGDRQSPVNKSLSSHQSEIVCAMYVKERDTQNRRFLISESDHWYGGEEGGEVERTR